MKKVITLCIAILSFTSYGANISGRVLDQDHTPIAGAYVYWLNTNIATTTNERGFYNIQIPDGKANMLVAGFIGFTPDTVRIAGQKEYTFILSSSSVLDDVVLVDRQKGVEISDIHALKVEQINSVELKKAACCDLAGCFETQNSVQPQTSNPITNSKELRLLGVNGVYNQILIDGLPMIEGLSFTYGISSFPGIAIEQISVSKGANSVIQGHQSISGQLDVQLSDPEQTPPLLINAYVNNFGEQQFNIRTVFSGKKWNNLSVIHLVRPANRVDGNGDDFLDVPLTNRVALINKWKYGRETDWGWNTEINMRWLNESRTGGQTGFRASNDTGSTTIYGQNIRFQQPEIWGKTRFRFNNENEFALLYSGYGHFQDSYFGNLHYRGTQWSTNNRFQYERKYNNHRWVSGVSMRYFSTDEEIDLINDTLRTFDGVYSRSENVLGVYTEHTWNFFENRISLMTGIRADQHNQYGLRVTPRFFGKFKINERSTFRVSAGSGWRVVNVFSENIQMLSSNRNIIINANLQPEEAFNTGINFTHDIDWKRMGITGYVTMDYYYTQFQNQVFPDYLSSGTEIIIQNFDGESTSHAGQVDLNLNYKQVEFKVGYNYLDVFQKAENGKQTLPFTPNNRWMSALSYQTKNEKWKIDLHYHRTGVQRLPETQSNPIPFQRPEFSEAFQTFNFQVTLSLDKIDFYTGCENIFNYKQANPIISAHDPFSRFFDTSSVWGPIRGREFYIGFRYTPEQRI